MCRFLSLAAVGCMVLLFWATNSSGQNAGPQALQLPGMLGNMKLEQIQKELNLTDEQKMKLLQLAMAPPSGREAVEKQISKILTAEQLARVKQLYLQVDPASAILKADVAKELGLTPEQRAKIATVAKQTKDKVLSKAMRGAKGGKNAHGVHGQGGDHRTLMIEAQEKVRSEVLPKILEILTPEQREKFEQMQGEKINFNG